MNVKHQLPQYIAEFIGSFFLIFFGCGSMILAELQPSYAGGFIPVIWGGAVSIMIYAVGHISGAHFNPAVTLAFWSIKKFPTKRVPGYIFFQILGAIWASLIHLVIWGSDHTFGMTLVSTSVSTSVSAAFLIEVILSFALMFVIVSVATDSRAVGELAGIAIGSSVTLCSFVGGPMTNASMNPARSIAPAIFANDFNNLWLYILAPIIGTIIGTKTYDWIRCQKEDNDNPGCC